MKYLITFSYDGSKFDGYQKQPNCITVQEEIESKLTQINSNKKVSISASGRTDKGVHALNQKAHFILDKNIETNLLKNKLNKMLCNYIYIKDIKEVDNNFHARFNVKNKTYIYKINIGEFSPIDYDYIYQYNKTIDINRIKAASKYLIGKHDFKCFTKVDEEKETYVREIYNIDISINDNIVFILFQGNGFMRYMIRNIVGTLINVSEGKYKPESIVEMIDSRDRRNCGITAPSNGLYLYEVEYENN